MAEDLTLQILRDIRDAARETSARMDGLSKEVGGLREELTGQREDLVRVVAESEIRVATAVTDLAGSVRELKVLLETQLDLRPRVERCEREIDSLKTRLPAS